MLGDDIRALRLGFGEPFYLSVFLSLAHGELIARFVEW
jgi:hypothetical protein